jgi:hypothetical protein
MEEIKGCFISVISKRVAKTKAKDADLILRKPCSPPSVPLPRGERIKVRGKTKVKKTVFLQVIRPHLLVNILCD